MRCVARRWRESSCPVFVGGDPSGGVSLRDSVVASIVGVRSALCLVKETTGGSGSSARGTDLDGGGRDGVASCSGKIPTRLFWLWRSTW
jgi:hypothetical protein